MLSVVNNNIAEKVPKKSTLVNTSTPIYNADN